MAAYRVGPEAATVFDPDGTPIMQLEPGAVVVDGVVEVVGSLAHQHARMATSKRLPPYADKRLRPAADKTP